MTAELSVLFQLRQSPLYQLQVIVLVTLYSLWVMKDK